MNSLKYKSVCLQVRRLALSSLVAKDATRSGGYLIKMKYVIIIVFTTSFFFNSCSKETKEVQSESQVDYVLNEVLTSEDYLSFDGFIPKNGLVPNAEIAVKIAESVLKYIYGNEQIEKQKPFSVNLENDVWVIEGYWDREEDMLGGNVYMEIKKENGEILKIVHTK